MKDTYALQHLKNRNLAPDELTSEVIPHRKQSLRKAWSCRSEVVELQIDLCTKVTATKASDLCVL